MEFLKSYGTSQDLIHDSLIGIALKTSDEAITRAPKEYFQSHKTSNLVKDYLSNRAAYENTLKGIEKLKNRIIERRSEKGNIYTYIFKWVLCSYYLYKVKKIELKFKEIHKEPILPVFPIYRTQGDFKFLLKNNGFTNAKTYVNLAIYLNDVLKDFQVGYQWEQHQIDQINEFIIQYLKEMKPNALLEIDRVKSKAHSRLIKQQEVESVLELKAAAPIQASSDITANIASAAYKAGKVSLSVGFSLLKVAFWAITP